MAVERDSDRLRTVIVDPVYNLGYAQFSLESESDQDDLEQENYACVLRSVCRKIRFMNLYNLDLY